jgi:RNA polymerase sigma factor (sigma-70 family)
MRPGRPPRGRFELRRIARRVYRVRGAPTCPREGRSGGKQGAGTIRYAREVTALLEADGARLHALLYRLTLRADVPDDLLQDLVVRLADSGVFASADVPYAFARTAAVRLATDWHRRRHSRRGEPGPIQFDLPGHADDATPDPAAGLVHREQWEGLLAHLSRLDERDRLLLTMRYLEGCDYDEIAAVTESTPHQARGLVHKALGRLRRRATASEVTYD